MLSLSSSIARKKRRKEEDNGGRGVYEQEVAQSNEEVVRVIFARASFFEAENPEKGGEKGGERSREKERSNRASFE